MSKIFEPSAQSWYVERPYKLESPLESFFFVHSSAIFPEYNTIAFKKTIEDFSGNTAAPDACLIAKDYSEWWIVEIETNRHKLDHIIPQISVFLDGNYSDPKIIDYVLRKAREMHFFAEDSEDVDEENLREMIKEDQPRVMVVSDTNDPEQAKAIRAEGASFCNLNRFENGTSDQLFNLSGDYPYIFISYSHCYYKASSRVIVVENPDILSAGHAEEQMITYKGVENRWKRFDHGSNAYLIAIDFVLPTDKTYILRQDVTGKLVFEIN